MAMEIPRRDYTYVDDIVAGIISALHYRDSNYEVFNLGNQHAITLNELVEAIRTVSGKTVTVHREPE